MKNFLLIPFGSHILVIIVNERKQIKDTLPENYDHPHFWNESQTEMIKGTWLFDVIQSDVAEFREVYEHIVPIVKVIIFFDDKLSQSVDGLKDRFTYENFLWGIISFWSRSFTMSSFTPLACLFNHAIHPHVSDR
jgi:hypothetical protein